MFWQLLRDYLLKANRNISMKARETRFSSQIAYFSQLEKEVESTVLNSDYIAYFDSVSFDYPSLEDTRELETLETSDILQFIVMLNHALAQYIDAFRENEDTTQKLYAFYELLKKEACSRIPSYPKEDGYTDYLNSRNERLEQKQKLEKARVEGNICVHCGSSDVRSHGDKWKCFECGRKFRKH